MKENVQTDIIFILDSPYFQSISLFLGPWFINTDLKSFISLKFCNQRNHVKKIIGAPCDLYISVK
jgi:hypothetical protein